ncbi:hypothetical protein BgiBS90_033337 [Biomphalaria glabrata]|nr:hypothetical protein BgiBS90_033337 [Biomphalaria glabrata]
MECFQTCVDQGNKCFFSKEKLTCIDCGKFRKGYSVPISRCISCQQTHGCKCPEVRCQCEEESCLEWFLSLFGLGQKKCTKDNCTSTASKGEERTAQASETEPLEISVCRSKEGFAVTLQRIGSKHKHEKSSKTAIPYEQSRDADKRFKLEDNYAEQRDTAVSTAGTAAGDDNKKRQVEEKGHKKAKDKSPKWTSSNSSTESRGRSRRKRRSRSRSKSGSLKGKEGTRGARASSVSSSGSRTGKGKSRSCSSSICSCSPIFKPYRHKYSFLKCSSYTPLTAPVNACTSQSHADASLGQKYSRAPSKPCPSSVPGKTLKPCDLSPPQLTSCKEVDKKSSCSSVQSAKMSCNNGAKKCCSRGGEKPTMYPIYNPPCPYFCKLPCRSQSFHSTMVSGPSPRAVCIPNRISTCPSDSPCGRPRCRVPKLSGNRKSRSCPRSCPCPIKSSCCSPPPCMRTCCPKACSCVKCALNSCCQCVSGCKAIPCPPTCTKPCCMPCIRKFQVTPYCIRPRPSERLYSTIPRCIKGTACPCPPGSCLCVQPSRSPRKSCCSLLGTTKPLCCQGFTTSYIKSKQGDAVCQQLLNRYGFSSTPARCCPPICTGMTFCPNPCNTNLCKKMSKPSCMCNLQLGPEIKSCCAARSGGCKSCRPCTKQSGYPSACEQVEDYTNSRKPTSPGCKRAQIILFNNEPCDKPPRKEFFLAPHCLRKTGPRSPVREFMDKMCVHKKKPKEVSEEEAGEVGVVQQQEKESQPEALPSEKPDQKENEVKEEGEATLDSTAEEKEKVDEKGGGELEAKSSSKKKDGKKTKSSKKTSASDENASAINKEESAEDISENDVLLFVSALSPTLSIVDALDETHLKMCRNNNHGCEQCVTRHSHFSQGKYYPGFRVEKSSYDPYGAGLPSNVSSFQKSRELRPSYDIYRLGTYSGPSFGFTTSCFNRPNDKRTSFDEKIFCTSRLSKNWNVNAINTTKFRTNSYNSPKSSTPVVFRNFPKAIIYSKLEGEIQRKIQQIKISSFNCKSNWRKQQLEMPSVVPQQAEAVVTMTEDVEPIQGHDPTTEEFINTSWRAIKQRQSLRNSIRPSMRQSARLSVHPNIRSSVQQNVRNEAPISPEEAVEELVRDSPKEEPAKAPVEIEKKDSCSSFRCNICSDNNDKDAKQSNCNHDIASVGYSSCASLASENDIIRNDFLIQEKPTAPVTVTLTAGNTQDKVTPIRMHNERESSVDGNPYELANMAPKADSGAKNTLFENESGNASMKTHPLLDVSAMAPEVGEEKIESLFSRFNATLQTLIQTKHCANGEPDHVISDLTKQQSGNCGNGIVADYQSKAAASRILAPHCSMASSLSSVATVTSSTTLSIASVSNIESVHVADPHRFSVVQKMSSLLKNNRSKYGVDGGVSPARGCDTPVRYLVRNAFIPKDGSGVFHAGEVRRCSPSAHIETESLHSDYAVEIATSLASDMCESRCRRDLVSGSSVDPGNESQNHPSSRFHQMCAAPAEDDQLLSASCAHITDLLETNSPPGSSFSSAEPDNSKAPSTDVSITQNLFLIMIRLFASPA